MPRTRDVLTQNCPWQMDNLPSAARIAPARWFFLGAREVGRGAAAPETNPRHANGTRLFEWLHKAPESIPGVPNIGHFGARK